MEESAPLRILHVAAPARTGGLESVLVHLSSGLRARGHDAQVAVVLTPDTEEAHPIVLELRDRNVPVHPVVIGPRRYLEERRLVRRLLLDLDVDVLHTHGFRPDVLDGGLALAMRKAHVMTLHGFVGGSRRSKFYDWLDIQTARRASAVIAVSIPIAERLRRHGITRQVQVLPNALTPVADALDRAEARMALGLPPNGPLVGWVGRVSHEKGPDLFVETLAGLPGVVGVLVGDGPVLQDTLQAGTRKGVGSRLISTGFIPSASRYLAAFDVLALTSRTEGTPMILLEAMWAGVPIVATAVGGVPHLLSEAEAWLCEPVSRSLMGGLEAALTDSASRRVKSEAAKLRVAREASPAAWLAQHERLYHRTVRA